MPASTAIAEPVGLVGYKAEGAVCIMHRTAGYSCDWLGSWAGTLQVLLVRAGRHI